MRKVFCQALVNAAGRPDWIFLTGDLGFMALETLREALGERFLNAGVAEQNMISVSAGLARQGLRPWVYSIAPFLYARPFEQIRNDVCLHRLPVVLVGNGGGYGYGVMGATHHALEDYGTLLCLPDMHVYVPAFGQDVPAVIEHLFTVPHPAYLRLGLSEAPTGAAIPPYSPWRRLTTGPAGVILAMGPLVGSLWAECLQLPEGERPTLWVVSELPWTEVPGVPGRRRQSAPAPAGAGGTRGPGGPGPAPGRLAARGRPGSGLVPDPHRTGLPVGALRFADVSSPRVRVGPWLCPPVAA